MSARLSEISDNDVVITGLGIVSPLGIGRHAMWESLTSGRSGVGPIQRFDPSGLPVRIAAEVLDFDPAKLVKPRKALKVMARDIQLGVAAAALAREDAALSTEAVDPERLGTVMGTNLCLDSGPDNALLYEACMDEARRFHFDRWGRVMNGAVFPLFMLKYLPNMAACHIGIAQDARAHNNSILMGEAGGILALIESIRIIERGQADVMLAGGASTLVFPLRMVQHCLVEPLSRRNDEPTKAVRPYDAGRDGYVHGEGSAVFVLERRSHAVARGATPLARIDGGASVFAGTALDRRADALRRVIQIALSQSGWKPEDVGHVNPDGWSIPEIDEIESQALLDTLAGCPVFPARSYLATCGAAAGPLELAASLLGMWAGRIPPALNYDVPDPKCPVQVIRDEPLEGKATESVLVLKTSRQGQAACITVANEAPESFSLASDSEAG